ncbi:hypothetical protein ES703_91330 [subsurface metagenome]
MNLVITLRKEVDNADQGEVEYEWVKQRLAEHPEVKVTGHITNHFPREEPDQ